MDATEYRSGLQQDADLHIGQLVRVRWGYGSGFRAEGMGRIVRIFPKSVRVQLDAPVSLEPGKIGWPAGFTLEGIPRFINPRWNADLGVIPVDA